MAKLERPPDARWPRAQRLILLLVLVEGNAHGWRFWQRGQARLCRGTARRDTMMLAGRPGGAALAHLRLHISGTPRLAAHVRRPVEAQGATVRAHRPYIIILPL